MKLGWCATLAEADLVKRLGYDYLELPLAKFGLEDAASLVAAKRAVECAPLPLTAFNWFYPKTMPLVGPDVDAPRIKAYLSRAAELMQHAGARVAGLGSGWGRAVPAGFSRDVAIRQNLESYGWVADAFAGSGIVLGIEAQNRKETNLILTLAEAVDTAKAVNRPEVIKVITDFYHMDEEQEPLSHVADYADWIVHVQLADTDRLNPGTGHYDYDSFFGYLRQGGYDGTVSVECMVPIDAAGMKLSHDFLRRHCL